MVFGILDCFDVAEESSFGNFEAVVFIGELIPSSEASVRVVGLSIEGADDIVIDLYCGVVEDALGNQSVKVFESIFDRTVGNRVFCVADDGNTGCELWTSDGTRAGTRLVCDLYPGSESSDPDDFLVKGNELYVSATNQDDDRELYAYGDPLPNYTPNPVEEATIDADAVLKKEGAGKNKITGTRQDDIIGAGSGADQMKGGKGADSFYWGFDFSVSFGKKQADRVTDFKARQANQILLDEDAFGGFGEMFTFSVASNKKELRQAATSEADLIYFEAKGYLYFDQNEEEKGFGDGGVFAVLNKKPELNSVNIGFKALPGDMF